ncbi:MAG: NYN domain-containing protein [bacterium]|nr:NYN domain-containing protein [bacterium]
MTKSDNNFAYIDGANLHNGMRSFDLDLDYARFRVWLKDKYSIQKAYIFIGLIPKYKVLYKYLQEAGFTLIFKEVVYDGEGKPKGNCDADLVLQTVCDTYENKFEKCVIVSSEGDYAGLIAFLVKRNKCLAVLSPHIEKKCSVLIKRTGVCIAYIKDKEGVLKVQKEKAPGEDKTSQGSFS